MKFVNEGFPHTESIFSIGQTKLFSIYIEHLGGGTELISKQNIRPQGS